MRTLLQATALALAMRTVLGGFKLDIGYGIMARTSENLQTFTGNLGGAAAEPVTASGDSQHPFEVDGDTFSTLEDAMTRSCDNQHNACADVANAGGDGLNGDAGGLTVGMCETQLTSCLAVASANPSGTFSTTSPPATTTTAAVTGAATLLSSDANFLFYCDP